ncbi:MAG: GTPase HflX, partial [Flavobacteriales bacterium]|nr:GTPase HflX [Flavobacteriales bacterium]
MIDLEEARKKAETAVLVGLVTDDQSSEEVKEYLDELEFLATTADIRTEKRFVQRLHKPEGRTYIGSGKLQEVKAWMKEHGTDVVIFDDELTPAQQRNLE